MNTNNGGPAFPCRTDDHGRSFLVQHLDPKSGLPYVVAEHPGMTLRDYIATAAMTTYLPGWARPGRPSRDLEAVTNWSYVVADAMLKAREGRGE